MEAYGAIQVSPWPHQIEQDSAVMESMHPKEESSAASVYDCKPCKLSARLTRNAPGPTRRHSIREILSNSRRKSHQNLGKSHKIKRYELN